MNVEMLENIEKLKKEYPELTDKYFSWKCKVCGCTWDNPCPDGCYWVEENLCSSCIEEASDDQND